ncbi:MAG TPA: DUF5663 domain-containing protein [Candidatus Saccharimonadales bacterium]
MLKIDNSLLQEVGLAGLPDAEKNSLLKHIYETLEMRVGIRLADQMSNEQLDEFERYFEAKDDAGAFKWLETNFPNYKEIVQQEFDKLKAEVAQSAPQILSAGQGQAPAAVQPAPQAPVGVAPAAAPAPMPPANPLPPSPLPAPAAPVGSSPESAPAFGPQPYAPPAQPAPQAFDPAPAPAPYAPDPQQVPYPSQQPPAGPGGQ